MSQHVPIPVFKPSITQSEIDAATEALRLGWLGPGSFVKVFEDRLTSFLDLQDMHIAAVNTGTSAVHLGLIAACVSEGDEVITPSLNNIADFQSIKMLGASPVFCDILPECLTIDPESFESLITSKTRAVICLDYASSLCRYHEIKSIADAYGIAVVHDAAHSFGSAIHGQCIGSFSEVCTFSFDPVKNITCIDGGAVVTQSLETIQQIKKASLLGQNQSSAVLSQDRRSWTYDVSSQGYRYHLANLHAAIGLKQLERFEWIAERRRALFSFYKDALENISCVTLPPEIQSGIVPFIFVLRVHQNKREALMNHLRNNHIDTGIHWQSGHNFSFFKDAKRGDLSVTEAIQGEIVTLPFYPDLSSEDSDRVVRSIKSFFSGKSMGLIKKNPLLSDNVARR